MHALNDLVTAGKVLYLGVSDTPAWLVVKANAYARHHGLRPFAVYQGRWSASYRDMEREIVPMCQDEGMGVCPWGPLGLGQLKTREQRERQEGGRSMGGPSESDVRVSEVLEGIAERKGTTLQGVVCSTGLTCPRSFVAVCSLVGQALAYILHKTPYIVPIVGGRKVEHLKSNVEALRIELSKEDMDEIDTAAPFDPGFPMSFLFSFGGAKYDLNLTAADVFHYKMAAHFDVPPKQSVSSLTVSLVVTVADLGLDH